MKAEVEVMLDEELRREKISGVLVIVNAWLNEQDTELFDDQDVGQLCVSLGVDLIAYGRSRMLYAKEHNITNNELDALIESRVKTTNIN
jgi:hypothetical protein